MAVGLFKDAEGNYAIGDTIDGVFVPFATVPAQRVAHLVERGKTLEERSEDVTHEGHDQAVKQLAAEFQKVGSAKSSGGSS